MAGAVEVGGGVVVSVVPPELEHAARVAARAAVIAIPSTIRPGRPLAWRLSRIVVPSVLVDALGSGRDHAAGRARACDRREVRPARTPRGLEPWSAHPVLTCSEARLGCRAAASGKTLRFARGPQARRGTRLRSVRRYPLMAMRPRTVGREVSAGTVPVPCQPLPRFVRTQSRRTFSRPGDSRAARRTQARTLVPACWSARMLTAREAAGQASRRSAVAIGAIP